MVHVNTSIARPDARLIESFRSMTSATVYEASGRKGSVDPAIKPLARGIRICGSVVTVQCHPRDNLMLHKALQIARPGDVLVASTGGYPDAGYWGGLMTDSALARKLGGLVIDGCIRDSEEIIGKGFPIFCTGTCIRGTVKNNLGLVNHPLIFGGITINPGDLILGDDDGLVVVNRESMEKVLASTLKRMENEEIKSAELLAGKSSVELNKLEKVFESLGLIQE